MKRRLALEARVWGKGGHFPSLLYTCALFKILTKRLYYNLTTSHLISCYHFLSGHYYPLTNLLPAFPASFLISYLLSLQRNLPRTVRVILLKYDSQYAFPRAKASQWLIIFRIKPSLFCSPNSPQKLR